MSQSVRSSARPVAELVMPTLDPVIRKRGLARAEIIAWWPDIVGEAYARLTVPERIRWPRDGRAATLVIRCDPAAALQLSYELEGVRQRLNTYLGYAAVGAVKIVQRPLGAPAAAPPLRGEPDPQAMARLEHRLASAEAGLREALMALGRRVLARR